MVKALKDICIEQLTSAQEQSRDVKMKEFENMKKKAHQEYENELCRSDEYMAFLKKKRELQLTLNSKLTTIDQRKELWQTQKEKENERIAMLDRSYKVCKWVWEYNGNIFKCHNIFKAPHKWSCKFPSCKTQNWCPRSCYDTDVDDTPYYRSCCDERWCATHHPSWCKEDSDDELW